MSITTESIIATLKQRILSGAGASSVGGMGIQDHSAIGVAAAGKPKKAKKAKKEKVPDIKGMEKDIEVSIEIEPMEVAKVADVEAGECKPKKVKKNGGAVKSNAWLDHVAKFRKEHPDMKFGDALKAAKATYKK